MKRRLPRTTSRTLPWLAVAALIVLWALAAGLLHMAGSEDRAALGDHLWEVGIGVRVEAAGPGVTARVAVPTDTDHLKIIGMGLKHPGWQQHSRQDAEWGVGHQVQLTATSSTPGAFEVVFTVHQSAAPQLKRKKLRHDLSVEQRERYLLSNPLLGLEHESVLGEVSRLLDDSRSGDDVPARIFERARKLLSDEAASPGTVPEALASNRASVLERANTMVALCRAANIPARLVTGLVLSEGTEAVLHHWVEVYEDNRGWTSYDPLHGYRQDVPDNFLPFVNDRMDLVELSGAAGRISVDYAVTRADEFLEMAAGPETGWESIFYLTRLPLAERNTLAHLLLLPLAVLVTTLFRVLTGIRSYGVFMPALFAMAMVYAEWQMAGLTVGMVLLFVVLGRLALPARIQRQARLTVVLTLVIIGVIASISLMEYLGWKHDGKVVLLPVVITAILVDMFYRALEKEGPASAFSRLGWTLFQVVLCLPVMQFNSLGHWLVAHPEAHLLTLAAALAMAGVRKASRPVNARKN